MIEDIPQRMKMVFVALIMGIFACSMIYAYIFVIDGSILDDESKAMTYGLAIAAAFVILSVALVILGYLALRKAKLAEPPSGGEEEKNEKG